MTATKYVNAKAIAETSEVSRLLAEDKVAWYNKPNLRRLYLLLVPAALGVEMTTGYDGSVLNGLQAVDRWNEHFQNPRKGMLGLITASLAIGTAIGVLPMPYLNESFGRKFCVVAGSIIVIIGAIIQTLAINVEMLVAARIIMGLGSPTSLAGAAQLVVELGYPKERSALVGLFQGTWYTGAVIAAVVTLGTFDWTNSWSWRLPTLFQILPSLLSLIFIWFIPESPRWLITKDRHEEALQVLIKYHAEGDANSPFVAAEFHQIRETLRKEQEAAKRPWLELVQSKANRRRVFVAICVGFFTQWSGNGLISYYLAKVLATVGINSRLAQNQINVAINCFSLATSVGSSLLANIWPRRRQQLAGYVGITIMFSCLTAASAVYAGNKADGAAAKAVVALIFLYNGVYNLMQPFQYLYISEIFPLIIRSKGIAVMQMSVRIASAFNQFVNPIGLANLGWKFYLVYVVWLVIETSTVYFTFPETKGPTLEEVALVLEGSNANVELVKIGFTDKKVPQRNVRMCEE